jgi:hypothetical protein
MQRVMTGPFRGMIYQRGSYTERPCLLGTYEKELHPLLSKVLEQSFDVIVDVGAGCGYYAAGLAQWYPASKVIAYDADLAKHPRLRGNLRANGVLERVTVRGMCTARELRKCLNHPARTLLVVDIEGFEIELLDPERVEALKSLPILVETHEGLVPGCTATLKARFGATHEISQFAPQPRTLEDFPLALLKPGWLGLRQAILDSMTEHRDVETGWLFMKPKGPAVEH